MIKGSEVSQRRDTCCNSGQMICGAAGGDCDDGDVGDIGDDDDDDGDDDKYH